MATMAPPPPSTKSRQDMMRTRDTLETKISTDSWDWYTLIGCNGQEKEQVITQKITFSL